MYSDLSRYRHGGMYELQAFVLFLAAAHAGGIARAGTQLHITPQTLSGQIKLLEDSLNKKLFKRAAATLN